VHSHDHVLDERSDDVERAHNQVLTDGKMSAKRAAFARVLPHIQMTVEGKPTG
jgi:hypothetical protein